MVLIKHAKFLFLVLLLSSVALFSLSKIGLYLYDGIKSEKTYSDIAKIMSSTTIDFSAAIENAAIKGAAVENATIENANIENVSIENASIESTETTESIQTSNEDSLSEALSNAFDEITFINDDYVGYIHIADTNIQYPIVRGNDNSFYLNHDIYGQKNSRGSIFMDYRNNTDFSDGNTLVYGHNMYDQSMFNHLLKFNNEQFVAKGDPVLIVTKTEMLEYAVFAAYKTDKSTNYLAVNFDSEHSFDDYMGAVRERAGSGVLVEDVFESIVFGDSLLTLSTCESTNSNYRFVVHAVLR